MLKQTTNEVIDVRVKDQFFDDFDVFMFTSRNEKAKSFLSTLKELGVLNEVIVLYHEDKNRHYAVFKKNNVPIKTLVNNNYVVNQIFKSIDNVVVLNICLLMLTERDKNIPNCGFYKILDKNKNQLITLNLRFVKTDENFKRKIYLKAGIQTFTDYEILRDIEKYKCRTDIYATLGDKMIFVERSYSGQKYLPVNIYYKTFHNTFDKFSIPNGCDKYDRDSYVEASIFGAMMDVFSNNWKDIEKYVSFRFNKENVDRYENNNKFRKIIKEITVSISQMDINFVTDEEYQEELRKKLTKLLNEQNPNDTIKIKSWKTSSKVENGYNIVLLEEEKGDEGSDELYQETKQQSCKDCIIQHLVKGNETKEALLTCFEEMLLKNSLLEKKLPDFMCDILPKDKKYTFYMTTHESEEEKEIDRFHKLTIKNKDISYVVNQEDIHDEEAEYYGDEFFAIVDENENVIKIYETHESIFPDFDKMNEIITHTSEMNSDVVQLYYVKELLEDTLTNEDLDKKTKDVIENLIINTPEFNQYDLEMTIKEIRDRYFKSRSLQNVFKLIFGEDINLCLQKRYGNGIDGLYPAFVDVCYNDNKYMVAQGHSLKQKTPRGVLVRRYEYEGKNFFQELLPSFYVPFVKRNSLTVYPFVFKLLREAVEIE